ncbi:hypothetical protein Asi03nite_12400 [Actinoplanes siamensis]|uniref:Uncharacterized protein n=2 Tax=Actinoplanes siamensis TaxID=1223317 RepID=A0A919N3J0_9ACTN|nr:hypothetical protein Asi03nite_12400 [Actinoplanes siamensis]
MSRTGSESIQDSTRTIGSGVMNGLAGRVGAQGRDGQDFAVVAGDGTVQLPPEVLGPYPPGTLFTVQHVDGEVTLVPGGSETAARGQ